MIERKAKSRLNNQPETKQQVDFSPRKERNKFGDRNLSFRKYFAHLPTLFIAIFIYVLFFLFINGVDPQMVEDLILPNSYLPFIFLFYFANFFFLSFVFLNSKRGLFYSGLSTLIIFFKFQSVIIGTTEILFFVFTIFLFEWILFLIKSLIKHQN